MKSIFGILLCFCCMQIWAADDKMEIDENPKTIAILNRLDKVIGINEDFVQDIIFILKQYQENVFVMDVLDKFTEAIETKMEAHRHKIDACILREYSKNITEEKLLGDITMLENVLSIYLPPEITSGILNLMRASCPCAPYYQIESALNYFYGAEDQTSNVILNGKVPPKATIKKHEDCSSSILDLLRTVEYIRIDVLNDFKTFAQSFCFYNSFIVRFFDKVASRLANTSVNRLNGSKIDMCTIKEYTKTHDDIRNIEYTISLVEIMLGTKFAKRDFEDALNLSRAYSGTADAKTIQNALKYLYGSSESGTSTQECSIPDRPLDNA